MFLPFFARIGGANIDTTPNAFAFTNTGGAARNSVVASNIVQITGISIPAPATISGGSSAQFRVLGDASGASVITDWTTAAMVANGQYVQVRQTSSGSFATGVTTTLNVGGVTANWTLTTLAVTPGQQFFTASGTFVVPAFNTLVVELVGGGASGSDPYWGAWYNGNASYISALGLTANGGMNNFSGVPAAGGTASGGDTNTQGGSVAYETAFPAGKGAGPFGGNGAQTWGETGYAPGGGGCGSVTIGDSAGTGGGGGGYCKKTYTAQAIAMGTNIAVVVAAATASPPDGYSQFKASAGARGEIRFTWS
jgi:hypothetical protein